MAEAAGSDLVGSSTVPVVALEASGSPVVGPVLAPGNGLANPPSGGTSVPQAVVPDPAPALLTRCETVTARNTVNTSVKCIQKGGGSMCNSLWVRTILRDTSERKLLGMALAHELLHEDKCLSPSCMNLGGKEPCTVKRGLGLVS